MAINFPDSRQQIIDQIASDVQAALPQSNPFLPASFLRSLMIGYGGRVYEVYLQLIELLKELFPDTATGEYLQRWGAYVAVTINSATIAEGFITATGTLGATIPVGTELQAGSDNTYVTQESATITLNQNSVSSLSFSAGTVTATTANNHNYASNIEVTITGANQSEYNGTFRIFVTGANTFTYSISGSPVTPATGTILASAYTATLIVESDNFGSTQNLGAGAALTFTSPISQVNSTAYTQYEGITGGTDNESMEDYRLRVTDRWQNPNTPFNNSTIEQLAKTINGVTRVFIQNPDSTQGEYPVTSLSRPSSNTARAVFSSPHGLISGMYISISGATQTDYNVQDVPILVDSSTSFIFLVENTPTTPATGMIKAHFAQVQPGQVKVLFTRDNDTNIIPTSLEVQAVKDKLLTIKPAHTTRNDLIVQAPVAVPVSFTFDSITPDLPTMRSAIQANLDQFFRESTNVGEPLLELAYNTVIYSTIDPETGIPLQDFILNSPSGDVSISGNEIPTFGGATFA